MSNIIHISVESQGGKLVTTSRNIAQVFGKEHKNVIRAIESLECGGDFNRLNFELVTYTDAKGEQRPEYLITRDGFTLLAMGFTGREAMQFKLAYIQRFNELEAQRPKLLSPRELAQLVIEAENEKERLQAQVLQLAPQAQAFETLASAVNCHTVAEVAKLLGTGQKRFFEWLREHGYLMTGRSDKNLPYQRWLDQGLFKVVETPWVDPRGERHLSRKTLVTGKGLQRFTVEFQEGA